MQFLSTGIEPYGDGQMESSRAMLMLRRDCTAQAMMKKLEGIPRVAEIARRKFMRQSKPYSGDRKMSSRMDL